MRHLPFVLTTFRLLLGPVALLAALASWPRWVFLPVLIAATLSDIYDGVLARRLGIDTPALRRYDSVTDLIFYLFVLWAAWNLERRMILEKWPWIVAILISEAAPIVVCFGKFRRYPATHTYLAKAFGLCLLAALIALLVFNADGWVIISLAIVAMIINLEIIVIHLLVSRPPVDVKSVFALPPQNKEKGPFN